MGLMNTLIGLGSLLRDSGSLAEILRGNKREEAAAEHEEFIASLAQLSKEFEQAQTSWFDRLINGLNRIPRPALALGTLGLFVYAMVDPLAFAARMQGLILVPDPLWWLLGAIVSFYFGARELHYFRSQSPRVGFDDLARVTDAQRRIEEMRRELYRDDRSAMSVNPDQNQAIEDWKASRR